MPPGHGSKRERVKAESDRAVPYISKSRAKTVKQCPRKFYLNYIKGFSPDDNYYFRRGRAVHETFEKFYENSIEYVDKHGKYPQLMEMIPMDINHLWSQWTNPYIVNFLTFESRRMQESDSPEEWLPVMVEGEVWWDEPSFEGLDDVPPMMGYIDVVFNTSTLPGQDGDGITIVDFKTGNYKPQYEDGGVLFEGTFYAMTAGNDSDFEWSIDKVAGYYPKSDDLAITDPLEEHRVQMLYDSIEKILSIEETGIEEAERDEGGLCKWGPDDDQQCDFWTGNSGADPDDGECDTLYGTSRGAGPSYTNR